VLNNQTYSHKRAHGRSSSQTGDAGDVGRVHEEDAKRGDVGSHQTAVDDVTTRQHQGSRVEDTLELAVSHDGATEGDTSDVSSKEEGDLLGGGGRISFEVREVIDVGGDASEDRGDADQRVEGGDELGKVGDLNSLGDGCADGGATCAGSINIFV
jgi:hypothetical protein